MQTWIFATGFLLSLLVSGDAQPALGATVQLGAFSADISTLDPHRATATSDVAIVGMIFNGLVRFRPGSSDPKDLEPDLAESWDKSVDGKIWTFHLRKGVKFQGDWGLMTADDVVYSLKRAANTSTSSFAADLAAMQSVEKIDDATVRIVLKYSDASFLGRLANYHAGNIISKKAAEKLGDKFGANPVGTGPFGFADHVTQQSVKLVANEAYFRGRPKIDAVMVRFIQSDSARDLAFSNGELDLMYAKREQRWVEGARKRPNTIVDIFSPGEFRTLHLNMSAPPLNDIRVRQAIAHAINVDELIRFAGKDVAVKGCSIVPTGYLGEDCSAGTYAYDLQKAKALLAEAGHPQGVTVKAIVSNVSSIFPVMEVIQSQLAKADIKLDMNVVDHPTFQSQIRKDASAVVFYGAARFPVADSYLSEFYLSSAIVGTPTGVSNFSHCSVADKEIEAARVESDPKKQLALWSEAQRKIHDTVCAIPLFSLQQVWAHNPRLKFGYDLKGSLSLAPPITEATTLSPR